VTLVSLLLKRSPSRWTRCLGCRWSARRSGARPCVRPWARSRTNGPRPARSGTGLG